MRPWLNWIEHLTTDQGVRGSNPLGRANFYNEQKRTIDFKYVKKIDENPFFLQKFESDIYLSYQSPSFDMHFIY